MSEGERKLADTTGRFLKAVSGGRRLNDAGWIPGRIVLSNKRLVLAGEDGKLTVPLAEITEVGGRYDVNQRVANVSDYVGLRTDDDVLLVHPDDPEEFERVLYDALLDGSFVLLRHPAVEGGVVQDTEWQKGRLSVDEDAVGVAAADGGFVEIELDDVGAVETAERTVADEDRTVLEVEHAEGTTSVETYLAGPDRRVAIAGSLLRTGAERNEAAVDLDPTQQQVLTALYSGVSPFEIPDFLGLEVEEVEETYETLIELDVLDEVRKRREVTLTARGRNLASESMTDQ